MMTAHSSLAPSYGAKASSPDTSAARGLRAALARGRRLKAGAAPASPAPVAPAMPANAGIGGWIPKTAAEKQGFKIGTDRALAVMDHPKFAGRHGLAVKLLANPQLSAREIGTLLAVADAGPDEQADALAEMQAALAQARASVSRSVPKGSPASASTAVWEKAIAAVFANEEASA